MQAAVAAWLAPGNMSGVYPKTNLLFAFTGTVNATTPVMPAGAQIRGVRMRGLGKGRTVINWGNTTTPWFTANGRLRDWEIGDLTLASTAAGAKGFLFVSNESGANQDGTFDDIEFSGSWQYAYRFEGAVDANLNSEVVWNKPAAKNDATFAEGYWHIGANGNSQEDQFVNYSIRDSKIEGSHGDYLVLRKGGQVTLDGFNSWMHTGDSNGGVPAGRMFYMPAGSHSDSVAVLRVLSLKPELRGTGSILIDCSWASNGQVSFRDMTDNSNAFRVADYGAHIYRSNASVLYDHCLLGTHIEVPTGNPVIDLRHVRSSSQRSDASAVTNMAGNGIVRYTTTTNHQTTIR